MINVAVESRLLITIVARCRERHQGKIRKDMGSYRITWKRSGKTASLSKYQNMTYQHYCHFGAVVQGQNLEDDSNRSEEVGSHFLHGRLKRMRKLYWLM